MLHKGRRWVFVLEADPGFARFLAELLSRSGFRVVLFPTARRLFTALHGLRPSIIVADPVVPDMSDVNLLAKLRRDRDARDVPLVVMIGENDTALPLRAGAPMVRKPEVDGLVAAVQSVLETICV